MNEAIDDYALGPCQVCGAQFRILSDGTVRAHGQPNGGRCEGSRLAPASTHSPILDGPDASG
jgi:hypothetical protein